MSEIMLSIYVATYNHENYIKKALDSILMQKTGYSYEVLVGEDCSQDKTRDILKEYEAVHPGKFQIYYREHNMYKEEISNAEDLKRRCRGKYIIALEGDDFWTDPYKIDKQIRFLEEHPEYIAVAHNCVVVDEFSEKTGEVYQECKEEEYTIGHYAREIMPGQLATVMYRNFYTYDLIDTSLYRKKLSPGDRCIYFSLITNGKIRCIQEKMSAYRHITSKGTSFSATYSYKYSQWEELCQAFIDYSVAIGNREAEKYSEFMYMRNLYLGVKNRQITINQAIRKTNVLTNKVKAFAMCVLFFVDKHAFGK